MANEYRLGTADPVTIFEFSVTSWCNYRCAYCVTPIAGKRAESQHAFDHHPVDAWLAAFERVPFELAVLCRGGEPFLDHVGFSAFLTGITAHEKLRYLRVDTNGTWSVERYADVPRDARARVQLNISFHPTQIRLDQFSDRLARILEAGWSVGMVNYVMEAGQAADYERVRDELERAHGVYVNANPDAYAPGADALYLPVIDQRHKTGALTLGKSCFFPSIAWFISPSGLAERACGAVAPGDPDRLDFMRDSATLRALPVSVRCPQRSCLCLDRYAFLEEHRERGRTLDLLDEYVRAGRAHRH